MKMIFLQDSFNRKTHIGTVREEGKGILPDSGGREVDIYYLSWMHIPEVSIGLYCDVCIDGKYMHSLKILWIDRLKKFIGYELAEKIKIPVR